MALKEPTNVRRVTAASCANCRYRQERQYMSNHTFYAPVMICEWVCIRDPDCAPWGDPINIETTVCDGHKKQKEDPQ